MNKKQIGMSKSHKYSEIDPNKFEDNVSNLTYIPSRLDLLLTGILLFIVLYIPIWILISEIYSIFDNDYISFFEFLVIQIFVIVVDGILLYIVKFSLGSYYRSASIEFPLFIRKLRDLRSSQSEEESEVFNLVGYGKVKPCCYNSARLGDRYCTCGRVISEDLWGFVHEN